MVATSAIPTIGIVKAILLLIFLAATYVNGTKKIMPVQIESAMPHIEIFFGDLVIHASPVLLWDIFDSCAALNTMQLSLDLKIAR